MVDLDSNPTKLIEIVEVASSCSSRAGRDDFSIANDVAKYFAILPAIFVSTWAAHGDASGPLDKFNVMNLGTPRSAIISAIVFNALVIRCSCAGSARGALRPVARRSAAPQPPGLRLGGLVAPSSGSSSSTSSSTTSLERDGRRDDARGRLKVLLGMVAARKTYRMLQEATRGLQRTRRRDRPAGDARRAETAPVLGLEVVPGGRSSTAARR